MGSSSWLVTYIHVGSTKQCAWVGKIHEAIGITTWTLCNHDARHVLHIAISREYLSFVTFTGGGGGMYAWVMKKVCVYMYGEGGGRESISISDLKRSG